MEKKKLLFALIISILGLKTIAVAIDLKTFQTGVNPDTEKFVQGLVEKNNGIKTDTKAWCRSLNAQQFLKAKQPINKKKESGDTTKEVNLYIFVTLKMSEKNLRDLIREAKIYGGFVIIRGIRESLVETMTYLKRILKDDLDGVAIDPTLFREYEIRQVPSFVLEQIHGETKLFDKLEGNVTVRYALERFSKAGDIKEEASQLLNKA
jgi:type-F conjugative transfer system pilin assembly protein TrbC